MAPAAGRVKGFTPGRNSAIRPQPEWAKQSNSVFPPSPGAVQYWRATALLPNPGPMNQPTTLPTTRPAIPTGGQEAIETTVDTPRDIGRPGARPPAPRFVPKPGVRAEVRPWGGGAGQDIALELLDLSELSVRVRLRLAVQVSGRFEVTLRDPEGRRWARVMATLCWVAGSSDGTTVATLGLGRPLTPDIVRQLAGSPVTTPAGRS